jgi:hypothetical protein
MVIGFWIVTALFCLQIGFTAYAQLRFPQVSEAFTHLGFPAYFRVELSWELSLRRGFGALGGSTDPAGQPQPSSPRLGHVPTLPLRRRLPA